MGIFIAYMIKSGFCLLLFYLLYKWQLAKETFFRLNRIMLLGFWILAFLLPAIPLVNWRNTDLPAGLDVNRPVILNSLTNISLSAETNIDHQAFIWTWLICTGYIVGVVLIASKQLVSWTRLYLLIRRGRHIENGPFHLILIEGNQPPFSWMHYIVLSEKDYRENPTEILTHEMAHIRHHHSWDLLLADVGILLQWFNPAAWLLKQEMQSVHEYEADDAVLAAGIDAKSYQLLLIKKAVGTSRYTMANSFNHSSLKKRIAMMLKQKSSPWARLKYLYVLPLAALTVVAFARPEISHELEKISSVKISEIIPVQEKKEPKRNVEVETLARDSVVFEKDMQAIQEKVSAVMEKYQPEIDKAVEEAVKAANIDEIVSAEMAKHQAEIDKAVQAAIEAAKIDETIAAEMEKIQPEINRTIEEAMKAIDINEKAAKEASKVKSSFSGIVYIDGVESSKERMDNLNPDRIASMNVYKGNEAIAKFGEKGRNGVIEIKLKK